MLVTIFIINNVNTVCTIFYIYYILNTVVCIFISSHRHNYEDLTFAYRFLSQTVCHYLENWNSSRINKDNIQNPLWHKGSQNCLQILAKENSLLKVNCIDFEYFFQLSITILLISFNWWAKYWLVKLQTFTLQQWENASKTVGGLTAVMIPLYFMYSILNLRNLIATYIHQANLQDLENSGFPTS